ncbi:MAG: F0F1 ATP synthase subunit B [Bacillota bacterium]
MVDINTTLIWEVVNFLVLIYLLKRFLFGPIMEMLDSRTEKIKSDLNQAREKKEAAQKLEQEKQEELKQARQKSQAIVDDAEKKANNRAEEIIQAAEEEAQRVKDRNMAEIEQAKAEAVDELRQEVAGLSLQVASKFLQEELDEEDHIRLINKYLEELDAAGLGETG